MQKIFFQSSMPRSGSTLFQNLVGQRPDFYVTPTSGVLELLFAARGNFTNSPEFKAQDSDLMTAGFRGFCRAGLEGFYKAVTDKKYVLDKSRGWGVYRPFLDAVYPDPKIVCLVRDLKDVVCSYEKIYRKNQALMHDPVRDDQTGRGTTPHKRVDEWMHPTNTIGRAVERIFECIRQGYDDKILYVKYEDLCLYPKQQMTRIYEYLGVDYYDHNFDGISQITKEDDDVYGLGAGLHEIRKELSMKPSDAKQILGADICDWLHNSFKWYYEKFGYKK
jgi:sulfotransferase